MTNEEYLSLADECMMDTYAYFPLVAEKGRGARLYDLDGREYIDFMSGIGVNSLGHCDLTWSRAVSDQASKLSHVSNLYLHEPEIILAKRLTEASGLRRVFFSNSGAEANEGAIKTARKYSFDKYGEGRNVIITLNQSFHGRTMATLSATAQDVFHDFFHPFPEGFRYIDGTSESLSSAATGDVCAIMLEPIQGEGGVNEFSKEFLSAIKSVCEEKDILLILDEVQTGIGRTGMAFAFSSFGLSPDILTLAKGLGGGLPIGAFLVGEKCEGTLSKSHHGSTFGGNPICCAGANAVLDQVLAPKFLQSVKENGERIKREILALDSPFVKEIRGAGMMIGVALQDTENKALAKKCFDSGLLVLTAGGNVLRLLPPLKISEDELSQGLSILKTVLKEGI